MNTGDTQDQTDNPNPEKGESLPKKITLEYDKQPFNDLVSAIKEQTAKQQEEKENTGNIGKSENKWRKETHQVSQNANRISTWAVVINTLIFLATLGVFIYNIRGVNAATDAATAAIRADSISISALKWDSIKNSQASFADSVKFQKQFDLAKKSLDEQIQSVKITQKNFEIENNPFIQVSNMKFDTIAIGHKTTFEFGIANFGKQPAMVISGRYAFGKWPGKEFKDFSVANKFDGLSKVYLPGSLFSEHKWTDREPLTPQQQFYLADRQLYFYLIGEVKYLNTVTKTKWVYRFCVRIELPQLNFVNVVNATYPLRGKNGSESGGGLNLRRRFSQIENETLPIKRVRKKDKKAS